MSKISIRLNVSKISIIGVGVLSVAVLSGIYIASNLVTIPAGYVGVKAYMYGSSKGVQTETLGVGRYVTGIGQNIYKFPTFNQLYTYPEPFNFQTNDNLSLRAEIGIEYSVNPEKAATLYQTYQKGVNDITQINLRQNIADSLIRHSGKMNIDTLAGEGRTKLLDAVADDLKAKMSPVGVNIFKLSWVTDIVYPEAVQAGINAKVKATQMALLRQNEIQQSQAEAEKKIAEANGIAKSTLIVAEAEAKSIEIKGEALRNNPQMLQLESINRWNGILPVYMTSGAVTPFVKIN